MCGDLRPVDDGDGVGSGVGPRPDLGEPGEQSLVDAALTLDLALQDAVTVAALPEIVQFGLDRLGAGGQTGLGLGARAGRGAGGGFGAVRLGPQPTLQFGELAAQLCHLGVAGFEDLEGLLILGRDLRLAGLQCLDRRGRAVGDRVLPRAGVGFRCEPGRLGRGPCPFERPQPLQQQVVLPFEVDDADLPAEGREPPLGSGQLRPGAAHPVLQEGAGRGRGLVAALQGTGDEVLRQRLDHRCRLLGVGAVEADPHQPRVRDRGDRETGEEAVLQVRDGRRAGRLGGGPRNRPLETEQGAQPAGRLGQTRPGTGRCQGRRVPQVELVDDAPHQGAALKQGDLGLVIGPRLVPRGRPSRGLGQRGRAGLRRVDLDQHRTAVDRGTHQSQRECEPQRGQEDDRERRAAADQQVPEPAMETGRRLPAERQTTGREQQRSRTAAGSQGARALPVRAVPRLILRLVEVHGYDNPRLQNGTRSRARRVSAAPFRNTAPPERGTTTRSPPCSSGSADEPRCAAAVSTT